MKISAAIDFAVHLLVREGGALDRKLPERVNRGIGWDVLSGNGLQPGNGLASASQNDALAGGHFLQGGLSVFSELQKADCSHMSPLTFKINLKFNLTQYVRAVNRSGIPAHVSLKPLFQWVFDSDAADDLSMVQIFSPQSATVGAFGGHDDQRIPKR
jgi:hypothetical protein